MNAPKLIKGRVTRTGRGGSAKARRGARVSARLHSPGVARRRDVMARTQRRATLRTK